jgi:hypothetical protein
MISLTSRYPAILTALFLIISAGISIYFYRNSSLPAVKKYLLTALKTLAIFLMLVLFIEPSLLSIVSGSPDGKSLVLIDNSRSNLIADENPSASGDIKEILNSSIFKNGDTKILAFSNSESYPFQVNNADSVSFNGFETNLSSALTKIKKESIAESYGLITVISDGVFNSGGNPLYQARLFQRPVITIGVGDTIQRKDAVLSSVYYEEKAFTGIDNTIKVYLNTYELQNENVEINLLREGSIVQTRNVSINNSPQQDEADFTIREPNPGIVRYSVKVSDKPGEVTYLNNRQDFLIEYLDNKTNILLISAGPGYDNAVIQNILKRTNNFNLTVRTVKNPNEFYEGQIDYKIFGELSAIFLLGFPISQFSTEITGTISSKAKEFYVPVIFLAQKNTDYKKLEQFGELLPFSVSRPNTGETQFIPQIVASSENELEEIGNELSSTPQIFRNVSGIIQKAGSLVLMTDKSSGEPVFITTNTGKYRSSAFLGYGLWRWNLNERVSHEKTLEKFVIESVNLTLLKDKKTKFKIYPAKNIFDYTENVKLLAEVYDDEYKPVKNAKVTGRIISNGKTIVNNIIFTPAENKYEASIANLPYGDYQIEGEAEMNNNFYAKGNSRFLADTVNTEYLITKSNFGNLRELSNNTGGSFFNASSEINDIAEKINDIQKSENFSATETKQRFDLWENKYVLLLIILLFSVEWVMRKRNNIP